MEDAVTSLGTHDHLIPGLFQELAAPKLPADRLLPHVVLLTRYPVRRPQGERQQRNDDVYAARSCRVLGRMFPTPWPLSVLFTGIRHHSAVIGSRKSPQGLLRRP